MKERGGPVARALGLAGEAAAAVRRRQLDREPRVVLFDGRGHPRRLAVAADLHAEIVQAAEELIALTAAPADSEPPA